MGPFIKERCIEKSKNFFDALKRSNFETFSKLSKNVSYNCKAKLFKYSLGLFPWALAGNVDVLKKLIKQRYYTN